MMDTSTASLRKRPVNLTLNEQLVAQARSLTDNLSATVESLLAQFVMDQQEAKKRRQDAADACASDWNAVHTRIGSFAEEHVNL